MPDASQPPIISISDWSGIPGTTITGGFAAGAPGSNLLVPQFGLVAQSGSNLGFTVNLPDPKTFSVIHLQNLTTDPSAPLILSVPDGHGYGGVTVLAEEQAIPPGLSPAQWVGIGRQRVFIVGPTTASQVNVSIGAGSFDHVTLGYVGIAGTWQAPIGMAYNWQIEIEDLSDKQRVPFGSMYITKRPSSGIHLRILHMAFDYLRQGSPYGEADDQVFQSDGPFELGLGAGQSTPVIGIPFPGDPNIVELTTVVGYINAQQQWTNPFFATWSTTFSIEQAV